MDAQIEWTKLNKVRGRGAIDQDLMNTPVQLGKYR
jgi:hypothetical protein